MVPGKLKGVHLIFSYVSPLQTHPLTLTVPLTVLESLLLVFFLLTPLVYSLSLPIFQLKYA